MPPVFLPSKAAAVGEGCKYGRCLFCFLLPPSTPAMFSNSILQPLLLKDTQRACFSIDFPSEPSQFLRSPLVLYKNIQENERLFFFFFSSNSVQQRKKCLGCKWGVETQDWIISGLGMPLCLIPNFEKQAGLELDQPDKIVVLRGSQKTGEGWEAPERTSSQEPPNTRSRRLTLQVAN